MDQENLIRSLKLQLRIERIAFGVLILLFVVRWGYSSMQSRPYAILADGKPVAHLATRVSAEHVLNKIKGSYPHTKPSEVSFEQEVVIKRASRDNTVVSEAEALQAAKVKLALRLMKYTIMIDGKPAAAVDSDSDANAVIEAAKEKYGSMVDNLLEEPGFKQDVKVQRMAVDPALYRSSNQDALDVLLTPGKSSSGGSGVYVVTEGDVAGKIADKLGMKLSELSDLNPGRNLARLQIGDQLKVSNGGRASRKAKPHLVVVVRNQDNRTEQIPYQTETVSSVQLFAGKQVELSPGRNGLRKVVVADTFENGVKTGTDTLEETIVRSPVPRRVAVGIRSR